MKRADIIICILLGLYSIALLFVDLHLGQEFARGYFSDIVTGTDYPLPYRAFFGINTSLAVVLLSGIALLFSVCVGVGRSGGNQKRRLWFQWSQILFFIYLAFDERLLIHEKTGSLLGVEDALLIGGLGVVELVLLFWLGDVLQQSWRVKRWLVPAAGCFAAMVCIDALFPSGMCGRLAIEDLSKTWAIAFLLVYAWQYCMASIILSGKVCDGA